MILSKTYSEISYIMNEVVASFSDDEILVAQILLNLPDIIEKEKEKEKELCSGFNWAIKKRRSVPDDEKKPTAADENNCTKRARSKYEDSIQELTRLRDSLRAEIQKVTRHYNQLNAYNSELKAIKQKVLNSCHRKRKPEREILTSNLHQAQAQPLVVEDAAREKFEFTAQFYSTYYRPFPIQNGEGFGLPPTQLLDSSHRQASRARFAEARRLRKEIIKIKSMRTRKACGIKFKDST